MQVALLALNPDISLDVGLHQVTCVSILENLNPRSC
jgi:hypothetical protein